jgi:hypothetical protein
MMSLLDPKNWEVNKPSWWNVFLHITPNHSLMNGSNNGLSRVELS